MLIVVRWFAANDDDIGIREQAFGAARTRVRAATDFCVFDSHPTRRSSKLQMQESCYVCTDLPMRVTFTGHREDLAIEIFVTFFGLALNRQILFNGVKQR